MIRDLFQYILFHRWNKVSQEQIEFVNKSGFNPSGLHLKIFNYIKKINNL